MNNWFKNLYLYILAALLCVVVSSCFKDKGNYEYAEIDSVSIDSFGRKAAFYLDSFILKPGVYPVTAEGVSIEDESRFSYVWTAAIQGRDAAKGDSALITIGTKKDLRIKLTMRPAKYDIYLKITDLQNGKMYYEKTDLEVVTRTYSGWVMLTDVNNVARIDMVSFLPEQMKDTLLLINVDTTMKANIPVMHGPREIAYTAANQGVYFYVTAADGGHKLDGDVFTWQPSFDIRYECFFTYTGTFSPGYVINSGSGGGAYLLYYNNNFYYQSLINSAGYGLPVNKIVSEPTEFDASPFIGKANNVANPGVLFDRTKKRFLRLNDAAANTTTFAEPNPAAYFLYNKVNMDLLYMVTNQVSMATYAVLKDPATNRVYVYSFTVTSNSLVQNFAKELTGTDIANAEKFAFSPEYGYMFYNVGSKVYEVNLDVPSVSKLVADLGANKITVMKFHQFRNYMAIGYADRVRNLMIASYDPALPAESCGTLSTWSVPGLFGNPVLLKSWSGFGKIVSLTYRER